MPNAVTPTPSEVDDQALVTTGETVPSSAGGISLQMTEPEPLAITAHPQRRSVAVYVGWWALVFWVMTRYQRLPELRWAIIAAFGLPLTYMMAAALFNRTRYRVERGVFEAVDGPLPVLQSRRIDVALIRDVEFDDDECELLVVYDGFGHLDRKTWSFKHRDEGRAVAKALRAQVAYVRQAERRRLSTQKTDTSTTKNAR